jgi:hypothetical protein
MSRGFARLRTLTLIGIGEQPSDPGPGFKSTAPNMHFYTDLVTPDALVRTRTNAEIKRWWQGLSVLAWRNS